MKVNFLISFHLRKTSASQQLWWNLIALEREDPFSHLHSHDGWCYDDWRSSAVTGILQPFPFIKSGRSGRREVPRSLKLFRVSTPCHSFVDSCCLREARCLIDHSFEASTFILTFQQPDHGRARTRWGDVPNSMDDDGDGFLPDQRHTDVSAILLLRLNALYQQSLNAADIAAHESWAHLSRWRDNAPDWKKQMCQPQPPIRTTFVPTQQDSNWSSSNIVGL